MSWICLTVGVTFIILAMIMALVHAHRRNNPGISGKSRSAGNKRVAYSEQDHAMASLAAGGSIELNMDAFDDPELAIAKPAPTSVDDLMSLLKLDDDESDDSDDSQNQSNGGNNDMPALTLASLLEVQRNESIQAAQNNRPRILGDSARELGMRYFRFLLAHHLVPRGATHLTNENNILVAENALRNSRQSATLSHGAVAQNIGGHAVCLFEPLESPVANVDKAMDLLAEFLDKKFVFVILASTEAVPEQNLAHLGALCKKFSIPRNCIFIEQPNGTFINYIEDVNNFVPARLAVEFIPQNFFSKILDYACNAYDEGDYEAVMRTVEPLLQPLYVRIRALHNFPKLLLAQALNLVGMTHRDIGRDDDAVACFDLSLTLLREIEDYEAIKSVMANLGITLALTRPVVPRKIELAIRYLNEVTQLNPRDDEAWLYLANSYLEQFRITNAQSLLRRALKAYEKAYNLTPTAEISQCMDALRSQIGMRHTSATPQYPAFQNRTDQVNANVC